MIAWGWLIIALLVGIFIGYRVGFYFGRAVGLNEGASAEATFHKRKEETKAKSKHSRTNG